MVDFFNKQMGLWNELENCTKRSTCVCGAPDKYVTMGEDDKVHKFLMGLDDDLCSNVRTHILALDPLPSLDRIYSMAQKEENHKKVMAGKDRGLGQAVAFAVIPKVGLLDEIGELYPLWQGRA